MKIIKRFDKECAKHIACALNYHSAYYSNSEKYKKKKRVMNWWW